MSKNVYWIRQSVDDDNERPDGVTYRDPRFKSAEGFKDFQTNAAVSAGSSEHPPERWSIPDLYASRKGSTAIDDWDYYMCSGTFGVFSQRAIDVLSPHFGDRFATLPARLEGHSFYCLRCQKRIDSLDHKCSTIDYFEHDPKRVMAITKYAFHQELLRDPTIFAIPELDFELFCTESIPTIAEEAGLRGFEFQPVS